jgi:hypothetical protein
MSDAPPPPKKRSSKPKKKVVEEKEEKEPLVLDDYAENMIKKRGRKPKGGKLIAKHINDSQSNQFVTGNIILHLRCSSEDLLRHLETKNKFIKDPLKYDPVVPTEIISYFDPARFLAEYKDENTVEAAATAAAAAASSATTTADDESGVSDEVDQTSLNEINAKLKRLKLNLYKNNMPDKKSACFWCTYDFDNNPCYIPKHAVHCGDIHGYGSFCRPECAVAFLMKENIDDSLKFERYQLLNQIYSKVYNFSKSIKPAPNPYYLLEKYYGTLTIQEYRKLLKTDHMMLVLDKPMTRVLPELHEDNDDMMLNIYGKQKTASVAANTGIYKVKKQSEKQQGPTKTSIIRNKFGLE